MQIVPMVLSGGAGSRLWPMTGPNHPKPFLRPGGQAGGHTLLGGALIRAAGIATAGEAIIVTGAGHLAPTCAILDETAAIAPLHVHLVLEDCPRDTAAAIAAGMTVAMDIFGEDVVLFIMPADQIISGDTEFAAAAGEAAGLAALGSAALIGIPPGGPDSQFGYLEAVAGRVLAFCEKPQPPIAGEFAASGRHWWNTGMVCAPVRELAALFERHCPELLAPVTRSAAQRQVSDAGDVIIHRLAPALPGEVETRSFDYMVLEKAEGLAFVEGRFSMSDLGTWQAWVEHLPRDHRGNATSGDVIAHDTADCLLHASGRRLFTSGVSDLMVIDGPDALYVGHRDRLSGLEEIARGHSALPQGPEGDLRPWGSFTVLGEAPGYKVKRLEIRPGRATSLQSHDHRSEYWVVVAGTGKAMIDGDHVELREGVMLAVARGARHQIECDGTVPLVIIETQTGDCLEENDQTRHHDRYGRASPGKNR